MSGKVGIKIHPDCTTMIKDCERVLWLEDGTDLDRTEQGMGNATDTFSYLYREALFRSRLRGWPQRGSFINDSHWRSDKSKTLKEQHELYKAYSDEWLFFVRSYMGGKMYRNGNYLLRHAFESQENFTSVGSR